MKKFSSLLCAFTMLVAILTFAVLDASAKSILPEVQLNRTTYEYTGKPVGPGLKVYDENGQLLTSQKDYTIKYNGGRTEPGVYTVTVTFIGDYAENAPVTKEFSITDNHVDVKLNRTSYEFAGKPLGPGFTVTDSSGRVLTKNVDYDYQYSSGRVEPGTYYVTINLKGNYRGTIKKYFEITDNKVDIHLNRTSYVYTGEPLGPGFTVTDSSGRVLTKNVDYDYKYCEGRVEPGTYYVTVSLKGNYRGTEKAYYEITENKINVDLNYTSYEYTGKPMGPGLTVTDSAGKTLTRNKDYTLKYNGDRTLPGTYSVTVSFTGDYAYQKPITKEFSITESKVNVKLNRTSYEYTGTPLGPGLTVTDSKGRVLERDKDYTLKYNGTRILPGTYSVTVMLKGAYYGTISKAYTITENIVDVKLNRTSYEFAGKPLGPGFTVTDSSGRVLTKNVDYDYQYSDGRVEPGTYYVTITLKGNYRGSFKKEFQITNNKINIALNNTNYEYTGTPLGPGLTVTDSKGRVLERDKDYTLKYNGERIYPGKYSVTVTLMGNYRGSATASYTIGPPGVNDSSLKISIGSQDVTLSWNKVTTQTTGYQIQYSTNSNFSNAKSITISSVSSTSQTINGLDFSTKYYVRIRTYKTAGKETYYSNWSKSVSATTHRNPIVDVAESQLGYSGGKKFWTWAGYSKRVAWCNIFVTWCADQCGFYKSGAVPLFQQPQDTLEWYQARRLFKKRGSYTPKPGDLIFFNWGTNHAQHIGIVERVENGNVYTIEGNSRDVVKRQGYSLSSYGIIGYATPRY